MAAARLPGIDGVEFDVRFSGDGEPVLLHDETLARVQGVGERAAALRAAELIRLGVSPLAEALAAMPVSAFLDAELKEVPNERFAAVLRAARGERPVRAAISSFDGAALEVARALLPDWPRWLNALMIDPKALEVALRLGCRGLSVDHRTLDRTTVALAHAAALVVVAWTLTNRADERRAMDLAVDCAIVEGAITTQARAPVRAAPEPGGG